MEPYEESTDLTAAYLITDYIQNADEKMRILGRYKNDALLEGSMSILHNRGKVPAPGLLLENFRTKRTDEYKEYSYDLTQSE